MTNCQQVTGIQGFRELIPGGLGYLPTAAGWVYLAVDIDLFSRKVVGWALSISLATDLVAQALRQANESCQPNGSQLLQPSDRGYHYTSDAYQQTLRILGIHEPQQLLLQNSVAERFFWSLKHEWTRLPWS